MSFLNVNGVDLLPSVSAGFEIAPETVGPGLTRATGGSGRYSSTADKLRMKGTTIARTMQDAVFIQALLKAKQDHWPWVIDLLSDKGKAPDTSTLATTSVGGPWSTGKLTLGATTGQVTYIGVFGVEGATVQISRFESGAWHEYEIVIGNAGASYACQAVWLDGVAQATAYPAWFVPTGSTGQLQLKNTTGATVDYADMVLTRAVTTSQTLASSLYAFRTTTRPPRAPALTCSGDFNPEPLSCFSVPGSARVIVGTLTPAPRASNLRAVAFELAQV